MNATSAGALRGLNGELGARLPASVWPVSTVAEMVYVPPRFAVAGLTVQVLFAGAPAQESATVPVRAWFELSRSG